MDELERLEKAVVDTKASFDASFDAASDAVWGTADAWDDAEDAEEAAWVALVKARLELNRYLEVQDK